MKKRFQPQRRSSPFLKNTQTSSKEVNQDLQLSLAIRFLLLLEKAVSSPSAKVSGVTLVTGTWFHLFLKNIKGNMVRLPEHWPATADFSVPIMKKQPMVRVSGKYPYVNPDTDLRPAGRWKRSAGSRRLQRYRAGIEGLISGLMRGYGLKRCNWRGWQGFQNYVSLSIVTFNLQKIASLL